MLFFFFNDTATTEIYTLSLHDALPICPECTGRLRKLFNTVGIVFKGSGFYRTDSRSSSSSDASGAAKRSEEHTSELQSRQYLVCRLLLEKKKQQTRNSAAIFQTWTK